MPVEQIDLIVDESRAVRATDAANKRVENLEKSTVKTGKSATAAFDGFTTSTTRTETAVKSAERALSNLERKAALAGKSGAALLREQERQFLGQFGGTPEAAARITAAYDKLRAAHETTGSSASRFGARFGATGVAIAAVAGGIGAALASAIPRLFAFAKEAAAAGERADNLAEALGISATTAARLSQIAEEAGVNVGGLQTAARTLSQALLDSEGAGKKAAEALQALNVRTTTFGGALRDPGTVLVEVIDKLGQMDDVAKRNLISQKLFARGFVEIVPLLKNYKQGMADLEKENFASPEQLAQLREIDKFLDVTGRNFKIVFTETILQPMQGIGSAIQFAIDKLKEFYGLRGVDRPKPWLPAGVTPRGGIPRSILDFQQGAGSESAMAQQERFARSFARTPEAIDSRLKVLREERDKVAAILRNTREPISRDAFIQHEKAFKLAEAEIGQLERTKKAIQETAQSRERAADRAKKFAEELNDPARRRIEGRREFLKKFGEGPVEDFLKDVDRDRELAERMATERNRIFDQSEQHRIEAIHQTAALELDQLQITRDAQLRGVEMVNAHTVAEKVAVEQEKFEIERQFIAKTFDLQIRQLVLRHQAEVSAAQTRARLNGATEESIAGIRFNEEQLLAADVAKLSTDANAAVAAARDSATIQSVQLARDENQKLFDHLKDASERVFDSMLSGGKQFWNAWKNLALTAFREVLSSQVAKMLMPAFGGQPGAVAGTGGGGGILGRLGGLGSFAGAGVIPVSARTPPFVPGNTAGVLGAPTGGGAGGAAGSLSGFAGLKGSLSALGNIGISPSSGGIGGLAGGGLLLGGAGLAVAGLHRGGLSGLGMTTAGGALIGAKFGGPLGAAIGAGIGFGAGLVRLFIKGAIDKTIQKVQQVYGVSIDKNLARQIVDIAKGMGGLDLAIGSPQIRELLELYAMSTGQKFSGQAAVPRGFTAGVSGGRIFEQAGFTALGSPLGRQSSFPLLGGGSGGGAATQPQTVSVTMQLDGRATTDLMEGRAIQAVQNNPRVVARTHNKGTQASAGRREGTALQLSPGLVTS